MSRKLIISLALALLFISPIMAEETGGADWNEDSLFGTGGYGDIVGGHDHEYEQYEPKFEVGAELNLIVFESEVTNLFPEQVRVDTAYDVANENGSVYLVATYNLWQRWFRK